MLRRTAPPFRSLGTIQATNSLLELAFSRAEELICQDVNYLTDEAFIEKFCRLNLDAVFSSLKEELRSLPSEYKRSVKREEIESNWKLLTHYRRRMTR